MSDDTSPNLDTQIRASIPKHGVGAERLHRTLLAVLDEHPHVLLDTYSLVTNDESKAKYGRCQSCGNSRGGLWCPTVLAIARELGLPAALSEPTKEA